MIPAPNPIVRIWAAFSWCRTQCDFSSRSELPASQSGTPEGEPGDHRRDHHCHRDRVGSRSQAGELPQTVESVSDHPETPADQQDIRAVKPHQRQRDVSSAGDESPPVRIGSCGGAPAERDVRPEDRTERDMGQHVGSAAGGGHARADQHQQAGEDERRQGADRGTEQSAAECG